jgi:hypothetical protein
MLYGPKTLSITLLILSGSIHTHDFGLVARFVQKVAVMYAGQRNPSAFLSGCLLIILENLGFTAG